MHGIKLLRSLDAEMGCMMNSQQLLTFLTDGNVDEQLAALYGPSRIGFQRQRYVDAIHAFVRQFGDSDQIAVFSAPGRTELSGNHTDHNHGRVLAASIDLDVIAIAAPNGDGRIKVQSEGYPLDDVDLTDLTVQPQEKGTSASLIRGMAADIRERGESIGGFNAYTTSSVLKGSGLSSSAAFEVLIGTILNDFFCDQKMDAVSIAQSAQRAENNYFGKPCGLMDQMACSVGGVIAIDFANPSAPVFERIDCDFTAQDIHLCIVDTGGNHADLTPDYAAIPAEMKAAAAFFGKNVLRELPEAEFIGGIPRLRSRLGDRAVLRGLHFYAENRRVEEQTVALSLGDFDHFMRLVVESGRSSSNYLQNIYSPRNPEEQGLSLALCLAEDILAGAGAWRVHGGGFAGTILSFVPKAYLPRFVATMESVFGSRCCHVLSIRSEGGIRVV